MTSRVISKQDGLFNGPNASNQFLALFPKGRLGEFQSHVCSNHSISCNCRKVFEPLPKGQVPWGIQEFVASHYTYSPVVGLWGAGACG